MHRSFAAIFAISLVACGGVRDVDVPVDGASADAEAPDAATVDAGALCSASNLAACAYDSPGSYAPRIAFGREFSYTDVSDQTRTFSIEVRVPDGAPGPLPVVIYSHGGASGNGNAATSGREWGRVFTAAGYAFIAIAHHPRSDASRATMCQHFGITDVATCARVKYLHYDRPNDVRVLLDAIDAAGGPLAAAVDRDKILYMGHSAGAGATSMVAGATRVIYDAEQALADPRPIAIIGASIEGPGDDGFTDASFTGMTRPHLSLTGVGDVTGEATAPPRRRPFELMQPGDKYRVWITEPAARHGTFNGEAQPCIDFQTQNGGAVTRCDDYSAWLVSAALAFADAKLRGRAEAATWLASDNLAILSGSVAEWSRR